MAGAAAELRPGDRVSVSGVLHPLSQFGGLDGRGDRALFAVDCRGCADLLFRRR